MSPARLLLALPLAVAVLAGCGSDPGDRLRAQVAALTQAANEGDADAVRDRADALLAAVEDQREREQIPAQEAERLIALAQSVRSGADVIDEDLLERRRIEAEAEAAKKAAEQAQQQLAEERRKAEEAAEKAAEEADEKDEEERKKDEEGQKKEEDKDEEGGD